MRTIFDKYYSSQVKSHLKEYQIGIFIGWPFTKWPFLCVDQKSQMTAISEQHCSIRPYGNMKTNSQKLIL